MRKTRLRSSKVKEKPKWGKLVSHEVKVKEKPKKGDYQVRADTPEPTGNISIVEDSVFDDS